MKQVAFLLLCVASHSIQELNSKQLPRRNGHVDLGDVYERMSAIVDWGVGGHTAYSNSLLEQSHRVARHGGPRTFGQLSRYRHRQKQLQNDGGVSVEDRHLQQRSEDQAYHSNWSHARQRTNQPESSVMDSLRRKQAERNETAPMSTSNMKKSNRNSDRILELDRQEKSRNQANNDESQLKDHQQLQGRRNLSARHLSNQIVQLVDGSIRYLTEAMDLGITVSVRNPRIILPAYVPPQGFPLNHIQTNSEEETPVSWHSELSSNPGASSPPEIQETDTYFIYDSVSKLRNHSTSFPAPSITSRSTSLPKRNNVLGAINFGPDSTCEQLSSPVNGSWRCSRSATREMCIKGSIDFISDSFIVARDSARTRKSPQSKNHQKTTTQTSVFGSDYIEASNVLNSVPVSVFNQYVNIAERNRIIPGEYDYPQTPKSKHLSLSKIRSSRKEFLHTAQFDSGFSPEKLFTNFSFNAIQQHETDQCSLSYISSRRTSILNRSYWSSRHEPRVKNVNCDVLQIPSMNTNLYEKQATNWRCAVNSSSVSRNLATSSDQFTSTLPDCVVATCGPSLASSLAKTPPMFGASSGMVTKPSPKDAPFVSVTYRQPRTMSFIQIDKELKYLVDGVTVHMSNMFKTSSGGGSSGGGAGVVGDHQRAYDGTAVDMLDDGPDSHQPPLPHQNYILFDPPHLDFKEHPVGMPVMRKVVVRNVGSLSSAGYAGESATAVHLHSLSGNTLHFHCTFFQDKVVAAYTNTTFDVVFLGREEGLIENTIFIHTSIGTYKYSVRAVGTSNQYRLRPLVGVRMPLNSSYTPLIHLHNPHPHTLQVRELYSSGGDLHLELLGGATEGEASSWSVPPYQTRALARATFVARRENNHTAYIRMVTTGIEGDYLVVPVEVEVSSEPGLYCPHDGLHFPLLTPHHPPASLPLMLINSAHKHIHIQNVITTPVNDAITIDFRPMKVPPGSVKPTQVATVTFDPSKVRRGGAVAGKLLIKSKVAAYKLSVPFSVSLLHGHLHYSPSVTSFFTGPAHLDPSSVDSNEHNTNVSSSSFNPFFSLPSIPSSSLSSSLSWSAALSSSPSTSLYPSVEGGPSFLYDPHGPAAGNVQDESVSDTREVDEDVQLPQNLSPFLPGEPRNLTLTNTFSCAVVVYNVTLPQAHRKHFKVVWWGEVVLQQGSQGVVGSLQLLSVGSNLRLSSHVTIHTNITTVNIPLIAYNGRLTKGFTSTVSENSIGKEGFSLDSFLPRLQSSHRQHTDDGADKDERARNDEDNLSSSPSSVDLGTVGMGEHRDLHFYVHNENPVALRIISWSANVTWCDVQLLALDEPGSRWRTLEQQPSQPVWLAPGAAAVFRASVVTASSEGVYWGAAVIHTSFESLYLAFRLRTAVGQLTMIPTPVRFDNAFPGKVSSVPLQVLSTFGHSMMVDGVLPQLPSVHHFQYEGAEGEQQQYILHPNTLTSIGRLIFDPRRFCQDRCYLGFLLSDKSGQQWSSSLAMAGHVAATDAGLLEQLQQRYHNISAPSFNSSLVLHTSHLHAFPFTVKVSLVWPRVTQSELLQFPLTQLHNSSLALLPLHNPTDSVLFVQLLMLHHYPSPHVLSVALHLNLDGHEDHDSGEVFRFADLEPPPGGEGEDCAWGCVTADPEAAAELQQHRRHVEADLSTRAARESVVLRLSPGQQASVRVVFQPGTVGTHEGVVLVRNNLTVVDTVRLQGRGGQGTVRFANRKPDASATPLTFSLAAKHLQDCDAAPKRGATSGGSSSVRALRDPKLTVKRTFTARNTGDLSVTITGFLVAGAPCYNYGFKVIQCDVFTLEPNASRRIDIAFSPDFTLSKVQQSLELITDGSSGPHSLGYTLQATVPSTLLQPCSLIVPRPHWEALLFYGFFTMLIVMLAACVLMAVIDAHALIKSSASMAASLQVPLDRENVFDLRSIATTKDTSKNISNLVSNGVSSQGLSNHRTHYNTKVLSNPTCSNNNNIISNSSTFQDNFSKKASSDSIKNFASINGKNKSSKQAGGLNTRSISSHFEPKTKDLRRKSLIINKDRGDDGKSIFSGIVNYFRNRASALFVVLFARSDATSTQPTKLRKRHASYSSRSASSVERSKAAAPSVTIKDASGERGPIEAIAETTKEASRNDVTKHKSRYDKHQLCSSSAPDYQINKDGRSNNNNNGRFRRESVFSESEYVSNSFKSSHKLRQEEEETSSCSTESSHSEDISISDKDLSSKSESSSCVMSAKRGKKAASAKKNASNNSNMTSFQKSNKPRSNLVKSISNSSSSCSSVSPSPRDEQKITPPKLEESGARSSSPTFELPKDSDEGVFEIQIRGKGLKKGKGVSIPLADLTNDHCLELPYSPKTLKPPSAPADLSRRPKRKAVRVKSADTFTPTVASVSVTPTRPEKITPTDISPAAARPPVAQLQPITAKDSYSSKVSPQDKQKAKITPIGKILPEVNRVAPQRNLGVIGQKLSSAISPYNQHCSLSLLSPQEIPQHSPLQQFCFNSSSSLSGHSWDPKVISPSVINSAMTQNFNSGLDSWPPSQVLQPGSNKANVCPNEVFRPEASLYNNSNMLPANGPPWLNMNSIWSSNTWNSSASSAASPWPSPNTTAISQGLGFDPVGGWPASSDGLATLSSHNTAWPAPPHLPQSLDQRSAPHQKNDI
ncbi:Transmembrane protein 131-like [Trinorchestia longiramus]|nr:Transmembrane protein 131-like [Trinorchestia longiramus]